VAREFEGELVLAHHADDQIELVLMRANRGIEGYGAAGMREASPSSADPSIRILRPLLHFRKAELLQFAQQRNISFREDSSNAQLDAERNRVRHILLPQLRTERGSKFDDELLDRIAELRRREDQLRQAAKSWGADDYAKLSERTRRDIVAVQLERAGIPVTGGRLAALVQSPSSPLTIRPGITATLDAKGILQVREKTTPPIPVWVNLRESLGHRVEFGGGTLRWDFKPNWREIYKVSGVGLMFDSTRVGERALLRYPQEGDRVRLSGRSSARSLFDVLSRNKIPRERRDRVVVAATQKGDIFWVEGLRITEDFKLADKSEVALQWQWTRDSVG
jgi:tRNA(Ile)-lysidine synthetase-like protein